MFGSDRPVQYERVYEKLLEELSGVDLSERADGLGGIWRSGRLEIRMLDKRYLVSHRGVETAEGSGCPVSKRIILCYYVLINGNVPLIGTWVSYRDFRDSAFFMQSFKAQVETRIAQWFSGKPESLRKAAAALGAQEVRGPMKGDVCLLFYTLPKVPQLLIFYDRDEDLPASATVLFDQSADRFLDMECLAVLGWILADELISVDRAGA